MVLLHLGSYLDFCEANDFSLMWIASGLPTMRPEPALYLLDRPVRTRLAFIIEKRHDRLRSTEHTDLTQDVDLRRQCVVFDQTSDSDRGSA